MPRAKGPFVQAFSSSRGRCFFVAVADHTVGCGKPDKPRQHAADREADDWPGGLPHAALTEPDPGVLLRPEDQSPQS